MKQSRGISFLKSTIGTAVGFAVALAANALVLPWFGYTPTLVENFLLTSIYTVISVVRGYVLERAFEAIGWRLKMSPAMLAIIAERERQKSVEGWTEEHDDKYPPGELARAGACYALHAPRYETRGSTPSFKILELWPWRQMYWKPTGFRRDLVKAGALIVAEIERSDRCRKPVIQTAAA